VAKKAVKKEQAPSKLKGLLRKRVDVAKSTKLNRDVKTPRWLKAIGQYLKGSWRELREVRWPTRRVTWGQTIAVVGFTVVLVIFILALDYGFEIVFKQVIL
jgi:preprotein translocase SecE subunit